MKTKKIIFLLYAIIILLVPIYLVVKSEGILTDGTLYKFKPQAYDPFDPFRGKFLRVNYDTDGIRTNEDLEEGDAIFVSIGVDSDGFAFFDEAFKSPPADVDYLSTTVSYVYPIEMEFDMDVQNDIEMGIEMGIEIPDHMNKYFINEDKALDAENVFRWKREDIYIGIRILDGESRIEDIYVDGQPLLTFLEENDIDYEEMMLEEMMCEGGCEGGDMCETGCEDGEVCEGACEGGDTEYESSGSGEEIVPSPVEEIIEYENEETEIEEM